MGKQAPKPSSGEQKTARSWENDKSGFDQYCPKCKVWYPASSNAHAGH